VGEDVGHEHPGLLGGGALVACRDAYWFEGGEQFCVEFGVQFRGQTVGSDSAAERPGEKAATFSARYGQSTNGLDPARQSHIRDQMVELITMVEGFYACGIAASTYAARHDSGTAIPDAVFANIGKLLLATQIYDMHRVAHYVSGGLVVALPGADEDHNPETAAALGAVLGGRADIPSAKRLAVSRMIEDLTASYQGGWYSIISLHGGGSPEADETRNLASLPDSGEDPTGGASA
jgi:4-hydroxyphenylacetate 3-hydroxylase C terminal